jgi:hypothetical protein
MHENTNLDPNQDEILAVIALVKRVEMRRAFNQYVAELRQTWSAAECRSVQATCEKLNSVL